MGRSIKCPKCQLWFSAEKYTSCPHCIEIAEEQAAKKAKEKVITDAVVAYLRSEDAAKKEAAAKAAVENAAEKEVAAKAAAKAAVEKAVAEKKAAEIIAAAAAETAAAQKEEARKAIFAGNGTGTFGTGTIGTFGTETTGTGTSEPSATGIGTPFTMPDFLQDGKQSQIRSDIGSEKLQNSSSEIQPEPDRESAQLVGTGMPQAEGSMPHIVTGMPQAEGSMPHVVTGMPQAEGSMPHIGITMPQTETPESQILRLKEQLFSSRRQLLSPVLKKKSAIKIMVELESAETGNPENMAGGKNESASFHSAETLTIGWLVSVAGEKFGSNLPIYKGRNLIYTVDSENNSKRICALIQPEPENEKTAVYPGIAGSSCTNNGQKVEGAVLLNKYDLLLFENNPDCAWIYIPLVDDQFNWSIF